MTFSPVRLSKQQGAEYPESCEPEHPEYNARTCPLPLKEEERQGELTLKTPTQSTKSGTMAKRVGQATKTKAWYDICETLITNLNSRTLEGKHTTTRVKPLEYIRAGSWRLSKRS
ncbi:hypothetical protein PoB_003965900 [Plakobranchus ocellatus]|uniref:Uncharacterized protein n=1 Tax=Plakobranchus ocellatus TaxID=259542 RepID=A0AAV4B454_9GAST|nr:hypothetical protein PoB_003965900 [Plakobranchus ocellatus]